jgi:hypothetical protein
MEFCVLKLEAVFSLGEKKMNSKRKIRKIRNFMAFYEKFKKRISIVADERQQTTETTTISLFF